MTIAESSEAALEGGNAELLSGDIDYLQLTRTAYNGSIDYMTANLKDQWERNIDNFYSRHPSGSKYHTKSYKYRSRLFRPKTRASIRQKEAALVIAFFSTSDTLSVTADNQSDPTHTQAASILKNLVQLRMKKGLHWFQNVVGAFQETMVMGSTISHQGWDREEETYTETVVAQEFNPETGDTENVERKEKRTRVIKDEPFIELIPNENFLIDPGAHWIDPVGTTPYIIVPIPMAIVDVMDRMEAVDSKTDQPKWKKYTVQEIMRAMSGKYEYDSTRQSREGDRQDPKADSYTDINEYQIVWIFRVIANIPGEGDMLWYTIGEHLMLTDPVPVKEVYKHLKDGERPYVIGKCVIEAHRNYSTGLAQMGQDIQAATNDNLNQRFDNVKQVLNKRYFVKRDMSVDLRSLRRNVPGSITMMSDPERDVRVHETNDVTGSSFNEQNLFNADFDDITGSFSAGSVQTNRQMNETVGGMQMLKDPTNTMTEYLIRVFAETWATPVLSQIIAMEQVYETDENLIQAAGEAAKEASAGPAQQQIDNDEIDFRSPGVTVTVNVGFGVTDPKARVQRVMYGVDSIGRIAPKALQRIKEDEITKEIMGILGYQDGDRFFMTDAEFQQYQQQNPPGPDPDQLKIESTEKIAEANILSDERKKLADLEHDSLVWEARLMSDERKKAAELSVATDKNRQGESLELGKRAIDIGKLDNDEMRLAIDREDMLRKDAEIKDKETVEKNRSGGKTVESKQQ